MPTYEYACTACHERLEVVQSFTDASLSDCPVCSGRLRKVFSPVGVVFKGSGFYKTDSRGSSKNGSSTGSAEKSSDKAGKSDSSTTSSSSGGSGGAATPSAGTSAGSASAAKPAAAAS